MQFVFSFQYIAQQAFSDFYLRIREASQLDFFPELSILHLRDLVTGYLLEILSLLKYWRLLSLYSLKN